MQWGRCASKYSRCCAGTSKEVRLRGQIYASSNYWSLKVITVVVVVVVGLMCQELWSLWKREVFPFFSRNKCLVAAIRFLLLLCRTVYSYHYHVPGIILHVFLFGMLNHPHLFVFDMPVVPSWQFLSSMQNRGTAGPPRALVAFNVFNSLRGVSFEHRTVRTLVHIVQMRIRSHFMIYLSEQTHPAFHIVQDLDLVRRVGSVWHGSCVCMMRLLHNIVAVYIKYRI